MSETARRHIDHELRRVDESFAMLRPSKDLDERLDDLIDGRVAPAFVPWWTRALPAAFALAVIAVIAIFAHDAMTTSEPVAAAVPSTPSVAPMPAPEAATAVIAPEQQSSAPREDRVALLEEKVQFIDVPMGRLEVRAPSTVEVRGNRAVVTSGSARLFEKGKAARTLLAGQSIAWKATTSSPNPAGASNAGIDDDEIEAMLATARAHEARGAYAAAADVLNDLLARRPPSRVADTVSFERASLLSRARNITDACSALADHAKRFPSSESAPDVVALRARLACP